MKAESEIKKLRDRLNTSIAKLESDFNTFVHAMEDGLAALESKLPPPKPVFGVTPNGHRRSSKKRDLLFKALATPGGRTTKELVGDTGYVRNSSVQGMLATYRKKHPDEIQTLIKGSEHYRYYRPEPQAMLEFEPGIDEPVYEPYELDEIELEPEPKPEEDEPIEYHEPMPAPKPKPVTFKLTDIIYTMGPNPFKRGLSKRMYDQWKVGMSVRECLKVSGTIYYGRGSNPKRAFRRALAYNAITLIPAPRQKSSQ